MRKKSKIKTSELHFKNVLEESYGTLETWKLEEELGSIVMSYKSLVSRKFNWWTVRLLKLLARVTSLQQVMNDEKIKKS